MRGQTVVRCGLEEDQPIRLLEVPLWMFEPAACDSLRVTESRAVSVDALRVLKALLHSVRSSSSDVVVQAQHHCLLPAGGADANISESSEWPTDLVLRHEAVFKRRYRKLVHHGMATLPSADVMRFLGRRIWNAPKTAIQVKSSQAHRLPRMQALIEAVTHKHHRLNPARQ
jgi:hypothetical protein